MKKISAVCLCVCALIALSACGLIGSEPSADAKLEHIKSSGDYPASLIETAEKYPQTIDYVYDYPKKHGRSYDIDLSAEANGESVPLFIQWDERWGYEPYGTGFIGTSGCGPTALSMAAVYLTKNAEFSPLYVARMAGQRGYCVPGNGSSWTLISEGCSYLGLTAQELPLWEQSMKNALDDGAVLVLAVGPGDFTRSGHFIVVTGYTAEGFTVNDPNSRENSARTWSYDRLSPQIANLWSLSVALF